MRILGHITFVVVIFCFAVLLALPVLLYWDDPDTDVLMHVVLITLSIGAFLFGKWLAFAKIEILPFRVYEGGVTFPYANIRNGYAGQEIYVPASDIKKVTWDSSYLPYVGVTSYHLFHLISGNNFTISVYDPADLTLLLREVLECPVEGPA